MIIRQNDEHLFAPKLLDVASWSIRNPSYKRHVEAAIPYTPDMLARRAFHDVDFDARVEIGVLADELSKEHRCHRRKDANAKRPFAPATRIPSALHRIVEFRERQARQA